MHIEGFRDYCLTKPGVTEETPFGNSTLVFKVLGKVFALTSMDSETFRFNIKCDPEKAVQLREAHPSVQPGYHMNKKHWNTIVVDGSVNDRLLREWIDHSYDLVVSNLPKAQQQSLRNPA